APDLRARLGRQLDRFRQAGRETFVLDPAHADIDLQITVCVDPSRYAADVARDVAIALLGSGGPPGRGGFFYPDNFTFGTPLRRSRMEAAIQSVPGVRAVEDARIRRRGWFDWRTFSELTFRVGAGEVLRLDNDPLHPDRGSLRIITEGGA